MNFQKWFKKNFKGAKFGSCIQDDGLHLGWMACKKQVLDILNKKHPYVDEEGFRYNAIDPTAREEIEKL